MSTPMTNRRPVTPPRELVLASAGTGKTYHLSSRLIALLAHGEEPEQILASTFTRKAAGEILDRVLARLAAAALDPAAAGTLAGDATLDRASPVPADPAFWQGQLEALVRALHRFNVGTLDAFFVRTAGVFGHELDLPPRWRIAEETTAARLRSEALQQVIAGADRRELVELLRLMNQGAARRTVHDHMVDRIDALLAIHAQLDPAASEPWAAFGAGDGGAPPAAAEIEALAGRFERLPLPTTNAGTPRSNWSKAVAKVSASLRARDWTAFAGETLCQRAIADEPVYDRVEIAAEVCAAVEEGYELARGALRADLAGQIEALGRFTARYAEVFRELQRREGAYRFEDMTRLLAGSDPLTDRTDLYYRLDARTRHILLDEFQDTSLPQWEALGPLVGEVLSDGDRAGVVVADPKQSIYGWRGGEPQIVHHVGEHYGLAGERLVKSWRSSPVVLDFVNRVFTGISTRPILGKDDVCVETAHSWEDDFAPHEAAKPELPGYVRVEVGPRDEGRGSHRPRLMRRAAERVAALAREAPGRSIGVLTRRNRTVARLILELRRLEVDASEEGGTPLTDSAACETVLALLRLADHPDDSLARYHVAHSPLGAVAGLDDPEDGAAAARAGSRLRRQLVEDGYGPTLERLVDAILPSTDEREARRLGQLVELGHRHDGRAGVRPAEFVRLVEDTRVEDPRSAGVRVMTVHQSKGLEFDTVVLPELDEPLFRDRPLPALPWRRHPVGPVIAVFPWAGKEVRALFPELGRAHAQARAAAVRDGLSGFYVALTRARHALHVIVAADGDRGPGSALTSARLLREALAGGDPNPAAEGDILYDEGDAGWHAATEAADRTDRRPPARDDVPDGIALRRGARARFLTRRSPSQMEGGGMVPVGEVLRLDAGGARDRGSIVHAWFEEVEWVEDGAPGDAELHRIARRITPDLPDPVLAELMERFRGWLRHPDIREALGRNRYGSGAEVLREMPFVTREQGRLVEGIIDRLVLARENGRVTAAEIVDYKTDAVGSDPDLLARRKAHYTPQLAAYARTVRRLYHLDDDRVRARVVFLEAARVEDVPL
jgi:ATP-dependent helicase/nuclease subunit A